MGAIILTMAVRFLRRVNSSDYIEIPREILERRHSLMLTVADVIAVLSLCLTTFGLGYAIGSKKKKK